MAILLIFCWVYLPTLSKYREMKSQEEEMVRQIKDLDKKIEDLKEERNLLKNDKEYLEKVIRDELGLVKPGEVIYKFVQDDTKKKSSEAAAASAQAQNEVTSADGNKVVTQIPAEKPLAPIASNIVPQANPSGAPEAVTIERSTQTTRVSETAQGITQVAREVNESVSASVKKKGTTTTASYKKKTTSSSTSTTTRKDTNAEPEYPRRETR